MQNDRIWIRIPEQKKKNWRTFCEAHGFSLTQLIIQSVENQIRELRDNNLQSAEKLEVMKFIESQGNIYAKVENNVNQVARIVNGQNHINPSQLDYFNQLLREVKELKRQQNEVLKMLYDLLLKL